jgi:hypothetical protein
MQKPPPLLSVYIMDDSREKKFIVAGGREWSARGRTVGEREVGQTVVRQAGYLLSPVEGEAPAEP